MDNGEGAYRDVPAVASAEPATAAAEAAIEGLLHDLGRRKELYAFRHVPREVAAGPQIPGFQTKSAEWNLQLPGMNLHGAQLFGQNLFSPNTPFPRMLVNWQTGTGKTILVIGIGKEFIRLFRQQFGTEPERRPSVFHIGFTRSIIMADMLKYPELGFVSIEEAEELRRLRAVSEAAGPASQETRHLSGYLGVLRRRITDRTRGGHYHFYGYKEFANRIFIVTPKGLAAGFDVQSLYERSVRDEATDVDATFNTRLIAEVRKGNVTINTDLLESMKGGLVIADEVHNVYNMQAKNNYGVALQYALDVLADEAPRAIFLSATLATGSAAEIVDILNLVVPRNRLPGGVHLRREDFFAPRDRTRGGAAKDAKSTKVVPPVEAKIAKGTKVDPPVETKEAKVSPTDMLEDELEDELDAGPVSVLLPGALERIGHLAAGRVSFLLDTDTEAYPRRVFTGTAVEGIPYIPFVACPMSPFHERSLAAAVSNSVGGGGLPANAHSLYDIAFPNPAFAPDAAVKDPKAIGLYESGETVARLASAPSAWRDAAGVTILRGEEAGASPGTSVISGAFLTRDRSENESIAPFHAAPKAVIALNSVARPTIGAYSAKYAALVADVLDFIKSRPGKLMVYHHRVRMSGVLLIQELFRMNGLIDESSNPTDSTLCAVCGIPRGQHSKRGREEKTALELANKSLVAQDRAPMEMSHEYMPARFIVAHSDVDKAVMERSLSRFNAPGNALGYLFRIGLGSRIVREGHTFRAVRRQYVMSLPTDIPTLIQVFGRVVRKDSHSELPKEDRNVEIAIYVSTTDMKRMALGDLGPELGRYFDKMREYLVIQEVDRMLRKYAVDGFANYDRILSADPTLAERSTLDFLPYKPVVSLAEIRTPLTVDTFEAYGHGEREVATIVPILRVLFDARPVWKYADLWDAVRSGAVRGVGYDPGMFSEGNFALALQDLRRPHAKANSAPTAIAFADPFFIRCPIGPDGRAIMDVESYVPRPSSGLAPLKPFKLKISDYLRGQDRDRGFEVRLRNFAAAYLQPGQVPDLSLVEVETSFHVILMRTLVVAVMRAGLGKTDVTGSAAGDVAAVDMYRRFHLLISARALLKSTAMPVYKGSKDALKALAGDSLVGFMQQRSVELAIIGAAPKSTHGSGGGPKVEWQEVPHASLGIGKRQAENPVVIGFVVDEGGSAKFKIRPPISVLRAKKKGEKRPTDMRSLIRGAVCETRPRDELKALLETLSRRAGTIASERTKPTDEKKAASAMDLCGGIKRALLALEAGVRATPDGMLDGPRWIYLAMDHPPAISAAVR